MSASALRLAFPARAARVLDSGEPLVESVDGFVRAPEALRTKASLSVTLPKQGSQPIVLRAPSGLEIRVRQQVEGEGKLVGKTVAYERAGGTSFWTVGTHGAEEWITLEAGSARADSPALSWEIEGGTLRQTDDLVEVLDEAGNAHFRVTAPVAYGEGEREVPVRLEVNAARIDLYVDAKENEALLIDPVWTGTGSMASARVAHTTTLLADGRVLVAGGYDGSTYYSSAEVYNPALGTWTSAGTMRYSRYLHTATRLQDGRVLVTGGRITSAGYRQETEFFSPTSNSWGDGPNLRQLRGLHSATLLNDGRVLVAGGYTGFQSARSEVYNPATNTFSDTVNNLPVARSFLTLTLLDDGQVLAVGGSTGTLTIGSPSGSLSNAVDLFDPGTNRWTAKKALTTARSGHSAVLLPGNKVLVTNGSMAGTTTTSAGEIYDPVADTWTNTGAMLGNRTGSAAFLLGDRVLAVGGGGNAAGALSTAELYDIANDTWSAAPELNVKRRLFGAVQWLDGRVLVVGGENSSGRLASAELYESAEEDLCADVVCEPASECKEPGVCDPADGSCSYANKTDGTACNDGNPATVNDVCTAGVCAGVDLCASVVCGGATECKQAGVCDPADGSCSYANKADGTPCSVGACLAGICVEEQNPDAGAEDPDAGPIEDAGPDADEPDDAGGEGEDAGSDGGEDPDAGDTDGGELEDAGADAGEESDAGDDASTDAGDLEDAGDASLGDDASTDADAGSDDAGLEDAAIDAPASDADTEDAGVDAATGDASDRDAADGPGTGDPDADAVSNDGGCGCRTAGGNTSTGGAMAALALAAAVTARRRCRGDS